MSQIDVPVTGTFTYRDEAQTPAANGIIHCSPINAAMVDGGVVRLPTKLTLTLNEGGAVPDGWTLPTLPGGVYYRITETFPGGRPPYIILVAYDAIEIDLPTATPVVPVIPGAAYLRTQDVGVSVASQAEVDDHEERITALEEGGGGGAELSDANPVALGAVGPGTGIKASREDHRHQMPSAADVGAATPGSVTAAINTAAADATTKADAAEADAIAAAAIDATTKAEAARAAAEAASVPTTALGVSVATLVGGVVPTAQIPAIAVIDYLGVSANQAAMLAKTGQKGDWTIRSDSGLTWIITGNDPTQLASWTALSYPGAPVTQVNGQTGVVVLGAGDVGADIVGAAAAAQAAAIAAAAVDATTKADAAQANAIATSARIQVDIFTTSGTYTKPAWAKAVYVDLQAAGGGGGSGRKGAPGTIRVGGGGGASGGRAVFMFEASVLAATMAVVIGAPGVGAAAVSANSTNGNTATNAGAATFGSIFGTSAGLAGNGGGLGAGGVAGATSAALTSNGIGGGSASVAGLVGTAGGSSQMSGGGGGAGGGITAADVASAGGNSGRPIAQGAFGQAIGGAIATNGANGSSSASGHRGAGGAGGGSSVTATNAGNGGNAGVGSGGGGGGAGTDGVNNSGAGGNGGPGYVLVVTYG